MLCRSRKVVLFLHWNSDVGPNRMVQKLRYLTTPDSLWDGHGQRRNASGCSEYEH